MRFLYSNLWLLKKNLLKYIKQIWVYQRHIWEKYSQMRFQYLNLWLNKKQQICLLKCQLYVRISMLSIEESKNKIVYNLNVWECFQIVLWSMPIYLILYKDTGIKFDEAKSIKRT